MSEEFYALTPRTCKICGKTFIPAPEHIYKVGTTKVCSYTCMRKPAIEKERQQREQKIEQERRRKEKHREAMRAYNARRKKKREAERGADN